MSDNPRCIKCGKLRSDHNYFSEWGYLCQNGSNTFLSEDAVLIRPAKEIKMDNEIDAIAAILREAYGKHVDERLCNWSNADEEKKDAWRAIAIRAHELGARLTAGDRWLVPHA